MRRWCNRACCRRSGREELGLGADKIVISAKCSEVQDLIAVYRLLAKRCDYALHLGLTEAGMGSKGIVASTAALSVLLQEGIGDTIRISLTPEPGGDRTREVIVAQEILQTMGLRSFAPMVIACPGCGRTTSTVFQELAQDIQTYVRERMADWRATIRASRRCSSRSWAASSTAPANPSMPISASRCLAPANSRGSGLYRRQESRDLARRRYRGPVQGDRRGLCEGEMGCAPPQLSMAGLDPATASGHQPILKLLRKKLN